MNEIFQIDKKVPVIIRKQKESKNKFVLTMRQLQKGDSFLIPNILIEKSPNIKQNVYTYANMLGIKITVKRQENGFRVWRIK